MIIASGGGFSIRGGRRCSSSRGAPLASCYGDDDERRRTARDVRWTEVAVAAALESGRLVPSAVAVAWDEGSARCLC